MLLASWLTLRNTSVVDEPGRLKERPMKNVCVLLGVIVVAAGWSTPFKLELAPITNRNAGVFGCVTRVQLMVDLQQIKSLFLRG